jgi:hypothetical protein
MIPDTKTQDSGTIIRRLELEVHAMRIFAVLVNCNPFASTKMRL